MAVPFPRWQPCEFPRCYHALSEKTAPDEDILILSALFFSLCSAALRCSNPVHPLSWHTHGLILLSSLHAASSPSIRKTVSGGSLLQSLLPIAMLRNGSVGSSLAAMRRSLDVRTGLVSHIEGVENDGVVGTLATPLLTNQRRQRPNSFGFDIRDMSGDRKRNHQRVSAWRVGEVYSGGCDAALLAVQPQTQVQGSAGDSTGSSDRQVGPL